MMTDKKNYVIGTRGSLLAVTQSTQTKRKLEALTGDHFELKFIETSGDQISDIPLWQTPGKDFFTKELDRALLAGEIDLVIHSYKDLGSERPSGIHLAAVTKRYHSQDIIFIKKETARNISKLKEFVVGTSAPRRTVNLKKNLHLILPLSDSSKLTIKVLRGNINSRIKKLQKGEYHAIVLAMAGVERLCEEAIFNEKVKAELLEILDNLDFCILPQSLFPSAAAQGSLAIECLKNRSDNNQLLLKIELLNDPQAMQEIARERKAFIEYGGGCHLAVGINVKKLDENFAHIHQGENNGIISKSFLERKIPLPEKKSGRVFIGLPPGKKDQIILKDFLEDQLIEKKSLIPQGVKLSGHLLCAVDYGMEHLIFDRDNTILWAANITTMKKLAKRGHWCHGALDLEGERSIADLINGPLLKYLAPNAALKYTLLSHQEAQAVHKIGEVLPTYQRLINEQMLTKIKGKITQIEIFYWTSFFQYQTYLKYFPEIKDKIHCCGLGKTYQSFKHAGIQIYPFINMHEFYQWLS